MAYTLKTYLANKGNYGSKRSTSSIKYIVIHYTANDGDTDENNGKYFRNNIVYASAHYFVDSNSITQSVPDNYVAWSVGGNPYSGTPHKFYGKCTNNNSLSIELCDDYRNGTIYPSAATIENALAFVKVKMAQYGIPASNVIRHYDVTGKSCPAYWVSDSRWKNEFHNKLTGQTSGGGSTAKPTKPISEVAKEVIAGEWGNGDARRTNLEAAGYDYNAVQAEVNKILNGGSSTPTPTKSVSEIAKEVIAGEWGTGTTRKQKLEAAGYDYNAVQAEVNRQLGVSSGGSSSNKKPNSVIANEVIAGKWGSGTTRKQKLEAAGYNYNEIQAEVNRKLGVSGGSSSSSNKKSISVIANEVIAGKWGSGTTRKQKLEAAGYDYETVQAEVNRKLGAGGSSSKKSNTEIAKEVIAGKWGTGADRKKRLEAAGYNYNAVQAEVNRLL